MPKTNTELIQELLQKVPALESLLETESRRLTEQIAQQATALETAEEAIHQLRGELRVLAERDVRREREVGELKATAEKEREERIRLQLENGSLKQQLQDHIKQVEVWGNRWWGIFAVLIGAMFTLASGLIVTLAKK